MCLKHKVTFSFTETWVSESISKFLRLGLIRKDQACQKKCISRKSSFVLLNWCMSLVSIMAASFCNLFSCFITSLWRLVLSHYEHVPVLMTRWVQYYHLFLLPKWKVRKMLFTRYFKCRYLVTAVTVFPTVS